METVRVVAVYEISAKAAPHLQRLLREGITPQIFCTFLEATIHAEQVPLEDEVARGREQQGAGLAPERADVGEDCELARSAWQGELEPGIGGEGDGLLRSEVPPEGQGAVDEGSAAAGDTADSGAREGTGGDEEIVPKE